MLTCVDTRKKTGTSHLTPYCVAPNWESTRRGKDKEKTLESADKWAGRVATALIYKMEATSLASSEFVRGDTFYEVFSN